MKKSWKEAASVIIAASTSSFRNVTALSGGCDRDISKEKPDFQILALKKSSESPVLPGCYVFPGGTVNKADSSDEWISLFAKFGCCIDSLCKTLNNNNTKLPIFEDSFNRLPRCVSLRITAIREAFEESGILLCKKASLSQESTKNKNISIPQNSKHLEIDEIHEWRKRVLKNPKEFLNLCRMNNCYPDVTTLYLWSNWLTPSHIPVRFDSVFFVSVLENGVLATGDDYEIESAKWITAIGLLSEYYAGTSMLWYPQLYEVSRVASFNLFSKFFQFIVKMNAAQCEQWMPVRIFAKDGEISLLPGDEMYPKDVDYHSQLVRFEEDSPIERFKCHRMHRMIYEEFKRHPITIVITNFDDRTYKHVLPWQPDSIFNIKGHL